MGCWYGVGLVGAVRGGWNSLLWSSTTRVPGSPPACLTQFSVVACGIRTMTERRLSRPPSARRHPHRQLSPRVIQQWGLRSHLEGVVVPSEGPPDRQPRRSSLPWGLAHLRCVGLTSSSSLMNRRDSPPCYPGRSRRLALGWLLWCHFAVGLTPPPTRPTAGMAAGDTADTPVTANATPNSAALFEPSRPMP